MTRKISLRYIRMAWVDMVEAKQTGELSSGRKRSILKKLKTLIWQVTRNFKLG